MKRFAAPSVILCALLAMPLAARADEGMWTFDNLPLERLKERYDFVPTAGWLEDVRLSCVRFNDGGSGAFVSPNGLTLTNHHVALGQLQKMSSEKRNYARDGFYARIPAEEMKCPDLELNVLISTEDVTSRVLAAIDPRATLEERNRQRKAESARIEKESTDETGLRSDVIELYKGGEYWLYRYKKYTDVRLVVAPEQQAAFFGGDPDNFTFPRHDLDFAFFRVYEDGRAARTPHYFRLSPEGAREGDLVFVSGHPGSTNRLLTVKQLEYERDYNLPATLERLQRRRKAYLEYAGGGAERRRRAQDRIFGVENSIKAVGGQLQGLRNPALMGKKVAEERELRSRVARSASSGTAYGGAWDRIAAVQREKVRRFRELAHRGVGASRLATIATNIVRYVVEVEKPNEKRYEEYRDSALESLRFRLFSPAPIYPDLEEHILADQLQESLDKLGPGDPHVKATLEGRTPKEVARDLVSGTKLGSVEERKRLVQGGVKAVEASDDPLIMWALHLDPVYRELRDWAENRVESVEVLEGGRLANARFATYGRSIYPDATFTLRLSFGKVAGYDLGTTSVPWRTTFFGLYDRAESFGNRPPFDLSPLEAKRRAEVNLSTALNFVTTNDIIGGNSGSPVLNRRAEYVGLVFDGNIQSLAWKYAYDDAQGRTVAVHSAAILEALRSIYRMPDLAAELVGTELEQRRLRVGTQP